MSSGPSMLERGLIKRTSVLIKQSRAVDGFSMTLSRGKC